MHKNAAEAAMLRRCFLLELHVLFAVYRRAEEKRSEAVDEHYLYLGPVGTEAHGHEVVADDGRGGGKIFQLVPLAHEGGNQTQHESEEENRKHNHVQELRNKLPENRRNLGHIVVTILV
jgi:hypothetical protein